MGGGRGVGRGVVLVALLAPLLALVLLVALVVFEQFLRIVLLRWRRVRRELTLEVG
ncbi:hypothetical protein [Streptomyces sp. G-G2]|uniref:hypothetical protein n=1 Tax=Streptomyces sp. G-G2 TaxID=3046201 RepID=UPI0024B9AEA2|nr:hypothetical protein [Streptomyces sp. G-G2]MDJ0382533.1 hypothetical protein [Streptomyces sp. G-G2]